jgi:hypothetical protein
MVLLYFIYYDITNRVKYTHIYTYVIQMYVFLVLYVGLYIKHLSNYLKFIHVLAARTCYTASFEMRMCAPF